MTCGALLLAIGAASASGQTAKPWVYITPTGDGFDSYLAAAMIKKGVPVSVVDKSDRATLTLKAGQVQVVKESTRMKLMKCVMQSCANTEDKASASVQLVDRDGTVVWSYAVNGDHGEEKSMAETIAKHLKNDYFRPGSGGR
jgi:D-arabinose 1-dehydrogenase-like Zn-dependent alcohol dehydrogenase